MTIIKPPQSNLIIFFLISIGHVLLHLSPVAAQTTDPTDPNYGNNINPSVGIVIIALVVSLFLLGFFSMYIRHCAGDYSATTAGVRLPLGQAGRSRRGPRGLDAAVISSFPTLEYSSIKSLHIGKSTLECAVCLNEFEDDETLRLIPKCDHVFHPDCIDTWLASHTTCPVCRADLTPHPDTDVDAPAPQLGQISETHDPHVVDNDDVVIQVEDSQQPHATPECEGEAMERPLHPRQLGRSRTRRSASVRPGPRWLGMFPRSNSTGHVAENMERFTLRVPDEVRRQIISGHLNRTTSCVALPREGSSRRGPRVGEGSSRGGRLFGSLRSDRAAARSDRWMFSLAPPFFSRAPSVRSPKVAAAGDAGSVKSGKAAADSVHVSSSSNVSSAPPNLPPV